MCGIFRVDDFGQQKLGEMLVPLEQPVGRKWWTEHGYGLGPRNGHGISVSVGTDDNKYVLELRFQIGDEGFGVGFLEDHGDDVIANVPFPG